MKDEFIKLTSNFEDMPIMIRKSHITAYGRFSADCEQTTITLLNGDNKYVMELPDAVDDLIGGDDDDGL